MKRKLLFLISLFLITVTWSNVHATGDTYNDAYTLNLNQETNVNYGEYDSSKFLKFIAPESKYYEFQVLNPYDNDAYIYLYNSNKEELFFTGTDDGTGECIAYGNLVKGKTYYLETHNYADSSYNLRVIAKEHKHNFKVSYAFYDYISYECGCKLEKNGEISATLSTYSYTYDGKIKTPNVKINNPAKINLINNQQYKVSYQSGRKNVGTYKIYINFMDAYNNLDSITKTFTIVPQNTSSLKVKSLSGGIKVTWKKQTNQTTGYQIQYSKKQNFNKSSKITIKKNKTTKQKILKLKRKKYYYVRIRTYKTISGKTYYSNWSAAKKVKVK